MTPADKSEFGQLLAETLAAYGKPLPEAAMVKAWLSNLAPFSIHVVRAAMRAYLDQNGEFAPVPAGIAMRCKLMDGRPGAEEAWAIALRSQDEADTVVWTAECATAFAICRPVLDSSGAISARKPFLEAYSRLVAEARAEQQPATWSASVGWDGTRRDAAVKRAIVAGLLPAPAAKALLAGPDDAKPSDAKARAQLASIKQMLADGAAERQARLDATHDQRIAAENAEKAALRERVVAYVRDRRSDSRKQSNGRARSEHEGDSG